MTMSSRRMHSSPQTLLPLALLLVALIITLSSLPAAVDANYFRFGNFAWVRTNYGPSNPSADPRQVRMVVQTGWRRFPSGWSWTFNPSIEAPQTFSAGFETVDWGDGTSDSTDWIFANSNGLSNNCANDRCTRDWMIGTKEKVNMYPSLQQYTIGVVPDNCCRISNLVDGNRADRYQVRASIDLASDKPYGPQLAGLPTITMVSGEQNFFTLVGPSQYPWPVTVNVVPNGEALYTHSPPVGSLMINGQFQWLPPHKRDVSRSRCNNNRDDSDEIDFWREGVQYGPDCGGINSGCAPCIGLYAVQFEVLVSGK
jgi:hypothetical protein